MEETKKEPITLTFFEPHPERGTEFTVNNCNIENCDIEIKEDGITGTLKISPDSPQYDSVKNIMKRGYNIGVSSRTVAKLDKSKNEIIDVCNLYSHDFVATKDMNFFQKMIYFFKTLLPKKK